MVPPRKRERGLTLPSEGEKERPKAPSPEEYERLGRSAHRLRESPGVKAELKSKHGRVREVERLYLRYTGIGIQFVMILLLPTLGGYGLDSWLETGPAFLIVGAALGGVTAMVHIVREVLRMERRSGDKGEAKGS